MHSAFIVFPLQIHGHKSVWMWCSRVWESQKGPSSGRQLYNHTNWRKKRKRKQYIFTLSFVCLPLHNKWPPPLLPQPKSLSPLFCVHCTWEQSWMSSMPKFTGDYHELNFSFFPFFSNSIAPELQGGHPRTMLNEFRLMREKADSVWDKSVSGFYLIWQWY